MTDLAEAEVATPERGRRRPSRRVRFSIAIAVVVIAAGATTTAVLVARHEADVPGLTTNGGGWIAPDNAHVRTARAGPYIALIAAPRPWHSQTFELTLYNPASVSQTVLGLTDGADLGDAQTKAEPVHLTFSTRPSYPERGTLKFSAKSIVIAPHREFKLRLTHDTAGQWESCRSESWQDLSLQVSVDGDTRTETLDFGHLIMELRSPGSDC